MKTKIWMLHSRSGAEHHKTPANTLQPCTFFKHVCLNSAAAHTSQTKFETQEWDRRGNGKIDWDDFLAEALE